MNRSKVCVIAYNTTSTVLIGKVGPPEQAIQFAEPIEEVEQIVQEGNLETGDKTTIEFDTEKIEFYGTFKWDCERFKVKSVKVTGIFGAARIGLLTIHYKGEDEEKLRSGTIGASAALPTPLQSRL